MTNPKVKDKYKTERNLVYLTENRFSNVKSLNLGTCGLKNYVFGAFPCTNLHVNTI